MAHARRKIHDVHVRHPTTVTTEALSRIGELYAIESENHLIRVVSHRYMLSAQTGGRKLIKGGHREILNADLFDIDIIT